MGTVAWGSSFGEWGDSWGAAGQASGQTPAGKPKRRRVMVDGKVFNVTEAELGDILRLLVAREEEPVAKKVEPKRKAAPVELKSVEIPELKEISLPPALQRVYVENRSPEILALLKKWFEEEEELLTAFLLH